MSFEPRSKKHGQRNKVKEEHKSLPTSHQGSRQAQFPSNKLKLTRYFYNALLILFIFLIIGLIIYFT